MSLFSGISKASTPYMRPYLNVGSIFDIVTGSGDYVFGAHGESIMNGGLAPTLSIAGPPNSFKTVVAKYFDMTAAERYKDYQSITYDSEGSFTWKRLNNLAKRYETLRQTDWSDPNLTDEQRKFFLTSNAEMLGDVFFDHIKEIADKKRADGKKLELTTPFVDPAGELMKTRVATGVTIDSLSALVVTSIQDNMIDKNEIGSKDLNTVFMRDGLVKKTLINQLPRLSSTNYGNMYFILTAHVGDEFNIDGPYAPTKHKLTHAKKGSKITGTTKAFEFLNAIIYEIQRVKLLQNSTSRTGVKYPLNEQDRHASASDLLEIMIKPTRNKAGGSGLPLYVVVSQREGLLPHLTQLHNMIDKDACPYGQWGIEGNTASHYALQLLPDVKVQRTTVRKTIDENEQFRRALEITCDMMQIKYYFTDLPEGFVCSPAELREDLTKMGYDWDVLLDTRPYWVPKEHEKGLKPFLSTMDLLRMRKGLYHPYWLPKKKS